MPLERLFIWLVLLVGAAAGPLRAGYEDRPAILLVHSYHAGMPWVDSVSRGLHDALGGKAELVMTQLDVKRYPAPGREEAMAWTLRSKAAMSHARLVIAIDDYAYRFCLERRQDLFPGLPLVFGGVNFWNGAQALGTTGVVEAIDLKGTLELAQALHPAAKRLVVVNDFTETGKANRAALERVLPELRRLPVLHVGEGSFEDTEALLSNLSEATDIVLLLSWNLDARGRTRSYEEAIVHARLLCPAPLYGPWDFYMGKGLVGGRLLDGRLHGTEVGELAARVLAGEAPESLPIRTTRGWRLSVDDRELRRFGIPHSLLPSGVSIENLQVSLLERYWPQLTLVLLVIVAQALTISVLLIARRRRLRAEEGLRESEESLRVTLASIGDAMVATDARGGIVLMNPVAEQFTGRRCSEVLGQPHHGVFELLPVEGEAPPPNPISLALERAQPCHSNHPLRLNHANHTSRLVTVSAAPLRREGDGIQGVVAILRDVTDNHRLEEQLRQSQKTESVGMLASGVAHDFNNLLQIIQGNLQLLDDADSPAEEKAYCARQIKDAVDKASGLTGQLLAFGRKQKLHIQQQDIAELIENFLRMLRRIISENIELSFHAERGRFSTMVDRHQIEQVLLNLCVNARDAMAEGGRIRIELSETTFTRQDQERLAQVHEGSFIQITISDTGLGMSKETLGRIFDPFFTTKAVGKGTGLGLAVVQGIIVQHQGFINVYSEPGQGTSFRIYLPLIRGGSTKPSAEVPHLQAAQPGVTQGIVLFAEDDKELRQTTSKLLVRYGYAVIECGNGVEAFAMASHADRRIDVAILDSVMPHMGGLEAARRIRTLRPQLPIILCSGYPGQAEDSEEPILDFRCISKPYPAEALIALIQASMGARGSQP